MELGALASAIEKLIHLTYSSKRNEAMWHLFTIKICLPIAVAASRNSLDISRLFESLIA